MPRINRYVSDKTTWNESEWRRNQGRFAAHLRAESDQDLLADGSARPAKPAASDDDAAGRRSQMLLAGGYVPAGYAPSGHDPARADNADHWWSLAHATAEYDPRDGYPAMPDDWTPARTAGRAVSGHRRTTTRSYQGGGVTVRMPSATAVKSFGADIGSTFRLPVEAKIDTGNGASRTVTAWMVCTPHGPGRWTVTPQAVGGDGGTRVSEAVAAVLEARRPTVALHDAGDLLDKHRQRVAATGTQMRTVGPSWIKKLGYNPTDRLMVMECANGRYGYDATADEFDQVINAPDAGHHVGSVFNTLIKGRKDSTRTRYQVVQCATCGRIHRTDVPHTCQIHTSPDRSAERYRWESAWRRRGARLLQALSL